jgi:hypothetical protein
MHCTVDTGAQQGLCGKMTAHMVLSDLDRSWIYAYQGRYDIEAGSMQCTASTVIDLSNDDLSKL